MNSRTGANPVDAVVIGRNVGKRLIACLASLDGQVGRIIYVDSGSTDASVEAARDADAEVGQLDMTQPFTAARARNAGLALARAEYVQFVDGDCTVQPGWVAAGLGHLGAHPNHAVVCGRRREVAPEASVYNRLCDIEWDSAIGAARACGGDALMRRAVVAGADGFDADLIAGEEPDLCLRLRAAGWGIWRLDAEMTLHDAAILRFGQWWRRTRRAGYAYAEGSMRHNASPERHWAAETRRALIWGAGLPAIIALAAVIWWPAILLVAVYPAQVIRLAQRGGDWGWAAFSVLGKFAEAGGALRHYIRRARRGRANLIEYK